MLNRLTNLETNSSAVKIKNRSVTVELEESSSLFAIIIDYYPIE